MTVTLYLCTGMNSGYIFFRCSNTDLNSCIQL